MKEKPINIEIRDHIRQAREVGGFTPERFTKLISVTTQYDSDLERGVVRTFIPILMKICKCLSVSSDFILFGKDEKSP